MESGQEDEIEALKQKLGRRQRRVPEPRKMGDVLNVLMARRGYAQVRTATECAQAWQAAAGAEFAKHSRAGRVRRGVLEVIVRSSAVLQELSFQKRTLIEHLAQLAPAQQIRDVRFRVGEIE